MKIALALRWVFAAALCLCGSPVLAVDKFVCKRQSGGPMSTFPMTIDFGAKEIDIPSMSGMQPDPDSVKITNMSVEWSFMRGFVVFHRQTGELDWDMTSEYAYLEAIGQPAREPESNYRGRLQCEADGRSH